MVGQLEGVGSDVLLAFHPAIRRKCARLSKMPVMPRLRLTPAPVMHPKILMGIHEGCLRHWLRDAYLEI